MRKTKNYTPRTPDDLLDITSRRNSKSESFYQKVYEVVRQIPKGKVTTYGSIAQALGALTSSRLVGYALNSIPQDNNIPAQRVINHAGELSGAHHFGGYERMRWLLESEGVVFKGDKVDLNSHFWDPDERNK
ncbi:MAG: MGMT family protein [Ignavibacteriota bacterium]